MSGLGHDGPSTCVFEVRAEHPCRPWPLWRRASVSASTLIGRRQGAVCRSFLHHPPRGPPGPVAASPTHQPGGDHGTDGQSLSVNHGLRLAPCTGPACAPHIPRVGGRYDDLRRPPRATRTTPGRTRASAPCRAGWPPPRERSGQRDTVASRRACRVTYSLLVSRVASRSHTGRGPHGRKPWRAASVPGHAPRHGRGP